jgi:hypothetical protein
MPGQQIEAKLTYHGNLGVSVMAKSTQCIHHTYLHCPNYQPLMYGP